MNLNNLDTRGGHLLILSLMLLGSALAFYFGMPDAKMMAVGSYSALLYAMKGTPQS